MQELVAINSNIFFKCTCLEVVDGVCRDMSKFTRYVEEFIHVIKRDSKLQKRVQKDIQAQKLGWKKAYSLKVRNLASSKVSPELDVEAISPI